MVYEFQIQNDYDTVTVALGNGLRVTKDGDLRVTLDGKLVGYAKKDRWRCVVLKHITVEANHA